MLPLELVTTVDEYNAYYQAFTPFSLEPGWDFYGRALDIFVNDRDGFSHTIDNDDTNLFGDEIFPPVAD